MNLPTDKKPRTEALKQKWPTRDNKRPTSTKTKKKSTKKKTLKQKKFGQFRRRSRRSFPHLELGPTAGLSQPWPREDITVSDGKITVVSRQGEGPRIRI